MKTQPEEVIDRYNAAKLLRKIEISGIVLGALSFIVGTALTALAGPGEEDKWNSTTAVAAGILIISGPLLALWILWTLGENER